MLVWFSLDKVFNRLYLWTCSVEVLVYGKERWFLLNPCEYIVSLILQDHLILSKEEIYLVIFESVDCAYINNWWIDLYWIIQVSKIKEVFRSEEEYIHIFLEIVVDLFEACAVFLIAKVYTRLKLYCYIWVFLTQEWALQVCIGKVNVVVVIPCTQHRVE